MGPVRRSFFYSELRGMYSCFSGQQSGSREKSEFFCVCNRLGDGRFSLRDFRVQQGFSVTVCFPLSADFRGEEDRCDLYFEWESYQNFSGITSIQYESGKRSMHKELFPALFCLSAMDSWYFTVRLFSGYNHGRASDSCLVSFCHLCSKVLYFSPFLFHFIYFVCSFSAVKC